MTSYTSQQAEAALKPHLEKYIHAADNCNIASVQSFYHPNSVVVHKGKKCYYGPEAIGEYMRKFSELTGMSVTTLSNAKYEGVGDFLIISGEISAETEKVGVKKAKFVQIWKKDGEKNLILHNEFDVIA
ncbi:unnamed protein product [Caenorhabditis sp. 36 PRJEB53466]|nr:unnamed protein product [Caenorhabditis sp. 36 PRJEB53466]